VRSFLERVRTFAERRPEREPAGSMTMEGSGIGEVVVYSMAMSPYAAAVRLLLAEKGVEYSKTEIKGMKREQIQPWFARINPKMTVPAVTLAGEGGVETTLTDSREALAYFEREGAPGRRLVDPAKERETWSLVDEAYAIQLAALYCDRFRRTKPAVLEMMEDMHAKLLSELGRLSEEEPQLREEYEAKKREKETYLENFVRGSGKVAENEARAKALLDRAESLLGPSSTQEHEGFLFGKYSVADVVLTSLLATLLTFDCDPLQGRPNLAKVSGKDARACTLVGG